MLELRMIPSPTSRVRFSERGSFARDLDARVDAYFAARGGKRRDDPRMYLKTAVILTWFAASWVALVFFAKNGIDATVCAVSLGLAFAAMLFARRRRKS